MKEISNSTNKNEWQGGWVWNHLAAEELRYLQKLITFMKRHMHTEPYHELHCIQHLQDIVASQEDLCILGFKLLLFILLTLLYNE